MTWTAKPTNIKQDNTVIVASIDYTNSVTLEVQSLVYRISDLEGLKQAIRNQIAAFNSRDTFLQAPPPIGQILDVTIPTPTPPTQAELDLIALKQAFFDDVRKLQSLLMAVNLGIFAANSPNTIALQTSLTTRLANNPAVLLPLIPPLM